MQLIGTSILTFAAIAGPQTVIIAEQPTSATHNQSSLALLILLINEMQLTAEPIP